MCTTDDFTCQGESLGTLMGFGLPIKLQLMIPNLPDLIIYFVLMPDCFTLSKTG
jgi:hypothetical protein